MFKRIFVFVLFFAFILVGCIDVKSATNDNLEISNGYFSFKMPKDVQGIYVAKKEGNTVYIYEKISMESEKGGFVFGFKLYKNPSEYAGFDGYRKIGELTDKKGTLYDMVLIRPSDIFYGYGETVEKNYNKIYEVADNLEIKGVNGSTYKKGQGMKGVDLYEDVLKKHVNIIKEKWDYSQYIKSGLSPKYLFFPNKNLLEKIGYVYYDINNDGIDELLIGEITKGNKKGNIYNIYTMVNRKPTFVASADDEEQYFVCNGNLLCKETVTSKGKKIFTVNTIGQNSNRLTVYDEYLFDKTKDKANPWFEFKRFPNRYESISKKKYNEKIKGYKHYERFDYIPLSKVEE